MTSAELAAAIRAGGPALMAEAIASLRVIQYRFGSAPSCSEGEYLSAWLYACRRRLAEVPPEAAQFCGACNRGHSGPCPLADVPESRAVTALDKPAAAVAEPREIRVGSTWRDRDGERVVVETLHADGGGVNVRNNGWTFSMTMIGFRHSNEWVSDPDPTAETKEK